MTHNATAASVRNRSRHNYQSKPREGTATRELYDRFIANKGIVLKMVTYGRREGQIHNRIYHQIERLRNTYGLDIRMIRYGHWVLAGEWFGSKYIDYIAEQLEKKGQLT